MLYLMYKNEQNRLKTCYSQTTPNCFTTINTELLALNV